MSYEFDKFVEKQPVKADNLTSIDQKIANGDINAQFLLPLQEKIRTEVAKLTPAQKKEVMPTLKSIAHNTKHQLARLGLRGEMEGTAANDDFYKEMAA